MTTKAIKILDKNFHISLKLNDLPISVAVGVTAWLFRSSIAASIGEDFWMILHESALFSRACKITSLGIGSYQDTAKASAPQAPWGVPGCVAPQGISGGEREFKSY